MRHLPAYIKDKIALEAARKQARATHAQPCYCWACLDHAKTEELVARALARNERAGGEVEF